MSGTAQPKQHRWLCHPYTTSLAPLLITSAGLGFTIATLTVQIDPGTTRLPSGRVDAEVRILSNGQPQHLRSSMTSGTVFEIEMRTPREVAVYAWARQSDGSVVSACGGGFCGTMPRDTHRILPVNGGHFQFDDRAGRESVILLLGSTKTAVPETAGSVEELMSVLQQSAGACRAEMVPSGTNDGEHWAEVRSWCVSGQPVAAEMVLQHPR